MENPILPGATIGILGGGQLGRMMAIAARRMGFRVHCLDPQPDCPAAPVCDLHEAAEYSDLERVAEFARRVDVVTLEFENVPAAAAATAAELRPVRPSPAILEICQHRAREKAFLSSRGFPCARHWLVKSAKELCCVIE
ncbi:MAG: hypothetical protein N2322_05480, partial [Terrimicrobiaceae bacterium]|nr:hypothetical protein [Terrimicrobiaceae bacterium]